MPGFFIFNGKLIPGETPILGPESRAFRYGDGIFETMRIHQGSIPLADYHFDRCFRGLAQLGFQKPVHLSADSLSDEIRALCRRNGHPDAARVRLTFFRGDGGLYDSVSPFPNYTIQTWELPKHYRQLNENGLVLSLFTDEWKTNGLLANLKTNSALLYVMAARYARQTQSNEALVLNQFGRIADASIANLFWVRDGILHTIPLAEGPVDGVMRKAILQLSAEEGREIVQIPADNQAIMEADEIFLTNALYGIRWVREFGGKVFPAVQSKLLYDRYIRKLFPEI
jgi:branched-chain amino acid aminotransferase